MTVQGGYGKVTEAFIRGTNSDDVLVLVDGIKVGSVTTGSTSFEFVPVDQIERVEIVRGPNSSLYGSEAVGGVIQIFTRKGKAKANNKPNVVIDAGAGSYDTYKGSGTVSGNGIIAGIPWEPHRLVQMVLMLPYRLQELTELISPIMMVIPMYQRMQGSGIVLIMVQRSMRFLCVHREQPGLMVHFRTKPVLLIRLQGLPAA